MRAIPILLVVLGIGFLAWEVWWFRFFRRALQSGALPQQWRRRRKIAFVIGGVLVLTLPWHVYPIAGGLAMGIPFFAAWYDAQGRDFIGAITLPALLGNAFVWFLVPQLILAYRARKHLSSDGESHTKAG
jgi:hypothetical protein